MSATEAEVRIASAVAAKAEILDLRGLGLKALPPLPPELRGLRAIELGSNRLTALPDQLLLLRELRRLGLGNNRIPALASNLAGLRELVSLDLSENRLERLPDTIGSLAQLVEVSLYANRLTDVPVGLFALNHLERLDVSTNRLSVLPSLSSCRYSRLRALDASHNQLRRIPEGVDRLRALRTLNLANNRLTSLAGIEELVLLEELDVSNNQLVSVAPTLSRLPRLGRVDWSSNPIADAERESVVHYAASREQASAAVEPLISGGESGGEDARYFAQAPFRFNFDLAVGQSSAPDLIDLYYKKLGGHDVLLQLADGTSLNLNGASRTRALDFARSAPAGVQPARVQVGQAHGLDQMRAKRAFVVDALARVHGSRLITPGGETEIAVPQNLRHDVLLQWSDRQAPAEPFNRTVGVGFAAMLTPEKSLSEWEPLPSNCWIWLWCTVAIGKTVSGAIGGGQPLMPGILDQADLEVAVFSNPHGFEVENRVGTLRLAGPTCFVLRPADVPEGAATELIASRLFFKVKTPTSPGSEQLRVHLYHRGLLVQAFNITACVERPSSDPNRPPIFITTDYVLSGALEERQLLTLGEHTLSIFANESPGDMSGFRFYGVDGEIAGSANVETTKIGTILETARQALRQVSWGSDKAYDQAHHNYRYEPTAPYPDFKEDLVKLAKCGFQLWDVLAKNFAGNGGVRALEEAMRRPGVVQLGLKESSAQLLPLAILYDRPIETQVKNLDAFTLCREYWEGPDCLAGRCPNHGETRVVCPSGFWGFRHAIGVPIGCATVDAAADVAACKVRLFASAYAGKFLMRDVHLQELEKLVGRDSFAKTLTCDETVKQMRQGGFQLLYFYCHGGMDGAIPYVLVGRDDEDPNQIVRATLRASGIEWNAPRSLVFINGCHTTALEPEQAIDLVNGFVETARASGVIGTEVTVFEPLATRIGELFIEGLVAGKNVGTAMRDARRALLLGDRPNPLGLVYIPFALATLKLE